MTGVREQEYTVTGFCWETWERHVRWIEAGSPEMAEEVVHSDFAVKGLHFGCTGVYEGALETVDPVERRWVDPSVSTQDQMDREYSEARYAASATERDEEDRRYAEKAEADGPAGRRWALLLVSAVCMAVFFAGVLIGALIG